MGTDDILARHSELLVALNERMDRQTEHLEAIIAQLWRMNEGIIRALSEAARMAVLEQRVVALEGRR